MHSRWATTGIVALVAVGLLTGCGSSAAMGGSGSGSGSQAATSGSSSSSSTSGASMSSPSSASGSSAPSMGSSTTPKPAPDEVILANGVFSPASLTVSVGTKVTFVFDGMGTDHILFTAPTSMSSSALTHGQSWSYTFTTAGTYRFEAQAMPYIRGSITVH